MSPSITTFQKKIWAHYAKHRRSFPWRELDWENPSSQPAIQYVIVVSEIMLQQTQAPRVVPKFESFMRKFPDWKTLAKAKTAEVLREWQGLGYNRRAVHLQQLAHTIVARGGTLPQTVDELQDLPGIGPNTAGSILAFAFNTPHPFIETNIRTVFIHTFFPKARTSIADKKLLTLITKSLPRTQKITPSRDPRNWYYALMDYGVMLKQKHRDEKLRDPAHKSTTYKKQTAFKGSNRELRSAILTTILKSPTPQTPEHLVEEFVTKNHPHRHRDNILKNIHDLEREGFIQIKKGLVCAK